MKKKWVIVAFIVVVFGILIDFYNTINLGLETRTSLKPEEIHQIVEEQFRLDLNESVDNLQGFQYHDVRSPLVIYFTIPEEEYIALTQAGRGDDAHGGGLAVDHADGRFVGDDGADGGGGGIAGHGDHIQAHGTDTGHGF